MLIVIDAGHGGNDPGAVGNGLKEADVTGKLAHMLHDHLTMYECEVQLTHRGGLSERADKANRLKADYFISLHTNASANKDANGFETFIHTNASLKTGSMRVVIHGEVMKFLRKYGINDRGTKRANFAVLRETKMPAILIECLFITNQREAELLRDDAFMSGLAGSIAGGVALALGLKRRKVK